MLVKSIKWFALLAAIALSACSNEGNSSIAKVTKGHSYQVTPSDFQETIEFLIHSNDISVDTQQELTVGQRIQKVEDTEIIFNKIFTRENDVLVTLNLESKLNETKGVFLSPYEFRTTGNETQVVSSDIGMKVFDESGNEFSVGGGIKENEVGIYIHKEDFVKSRELKVQLTGLHLMEYKKIKE